jgi:hypothetical protein
MRDGLILATPFVIQAFWIGLFEVLGRVVYPKLAPDPREMSDAERAAAVGKPSYVGAYGQPVGKWAWLRRVELVYIVWLFPVMVPVTWIGRRDTSPRWVVVAVPALYSLLLYFFVVRSS